MNTARQYFLRTNTINLNNFFNGKIKHLINLQPPPPPMTLKAIYVYIYIYLTFYFVGKYLSMQDNKHEGQGAAQAYTNHNINPLQD